MTSRPARVLVVGSANVDFTVAVPRLPEGGETVSEGTLLVNHGGKGANQAVAACRLGADVRLIACVGADASGTSIRDALDAEGIGVAGVVTTSAAIPAATRIRIRSSGKRKVRPTRDPIAAAICPIGPSRPTAPPDASVMSEDAERQKILAEIAEAFAVPRPAWSVNAKHCCECAETEAALQALSPAAVDLRIAGSGGPFTLISNPDGFKYFLPALARLAYDSRYLRDFLSQIWYLRTDTFDIRQRAADRGQAQHGQHNGLLQRAGPSGRDVVQLSAFTDPGERERGEAQETDEARDRHPPQGAVPIIEKKLAAFFQDPVDFFYKPLRI